MLFTSIVEEIGVFSARSKGGPTSHSCLLYLKNQEEYLININIILDDRREKQAKSPVLDQSEARSTAHPPRKKKQTRNCNINLKSILK